MNRFGGVVLGLALLAPAMASAQTRPANTMDTRSASLYLDRAKRSSRDDEKKEMLEKALNFALEGIKNKPDNPQAYLIAGQVYILQGKVAPADSMFDKAEQMWPEYKKETENDRMRAWIMAYNAGVLAMRAQNVDQALADFEAADAIYSGRPGAKLNVAQIYARKQQYDKAIAAYQGALAILKTPPAQQKPEEAKEWKELQEAATFNLALLYSNQNKSDEAIALFREFLTRDPNNALAKSNLAATLAKAGKADEAAKMYQELLTMDLSDADFFNVGVGLFRANEYAQAAEAFRKAIAKNAHLRDAYYNQAQALYSLAEQLDEQRKAKPAEAKAIEEKLNPVLRELGETAEKLRGIDPANRNVLALQSRAYRRLGDLSPDVATQNQWKNKNLEVLKANEALAFEVTDISLAPTAEEVQLAGTVVNLKGTAGQPVKLRVTIVGVNGAALGTQEVTVALPETQGGTPFKVAFKTKETVAGWKYEVIS